TSMTSDAVANLNFRSATSMSEQKIRHIGSISRQICDGSAGGNKFTKTALAVFKVVANRSQPNCKRRVRELQCSAVLFIKATAFDCPVTSTLTIHLPVRRNPLHLL